MNKPIPVLTATLAVAAAFTPVAGAATSRHVTGTAVENRFGITQVVIYVQGKKITSIRYTLPTDRRRSAVINEQAGPLLRSEALKAQSAHIHVLSGATYSSEAFAQSLQAAITRAHLK